jgi:hypothetical protein
MKPNIEIFFQDLTSIVSRSNDQINLFAQKKLEELMEFTNAQKQLLSKIIYFQNSTRDNFIQNIENKVRNLIFCNYFK